MATLLKLQDPADAAREELDRWIETTKSLSLLRFITCGSVDDGKSTLIGRMLYDSQLLLEDQLAALASDSRKHGTQGEELDFALLVDGLSAEREQGITIDVAYRFFATDKRKFIVADTPGHEQYTRNMVTGASNADLAVILVDARKGLLTQTCRHSFLVHLIGIRNIVLAVNKMDLVDYDETVFARIVADYSAFAKEAGIASFTAIPVSGLAGDNITSPSANMPWYEGPALLQRLEEVPTARLEVAAEPFRMAVQWVCRPDHSFRGYAGRIASGRVRRGDEIAVLPAGRRTSIERIITSDGDLDEARAGQSVMITFTDEADCSRGNVVASPDALPGTVSRIDSTLVWMSDEQLDPNRSYWLKIGTQTLSARIERIRSVIDVNTLGEVAGAERRIGLNDIARVAIDLEGSIPAIRYSENRKLGGFILIDKLTNATVAGGLVEGFPAAAERSSQAARTIRWVMGEKRSGWAQRSAERLRAQGHRVVILDDAAIAGFGAPNLARTARQAARLLAEAGALVFVTLGVAPEQAWPGAIVYSETEPEGGDEWII